jgi:16S rRNA (cytidine1402-2'-O)-methyltransferase
MEDKGILYLIPTPISDTPVGAISPYNLDIIKSLDEFIVEDLRSARRFLVKIGFGKPIDTVTFHLLNEHTKPGDISEYLGSLISGKNMGLLSDAGCPVIADPGSSIVKLAHQKQVRVVPLIGPSSVIMALMASGFNGQNFTFHGYLPKQASERIKKIKLLEAESGKTGYTQIFIEAPYRNDSLIKDILSSCRNETSFCVASDITSSSELIQTKSIAEWKKDKTSFNDKPAIFLIGR